MTTDDSSNFLKTLAKPETWAEADDQTFTWKPPEENKIEVEPMKDGLPEIVSGDKFPKQYELQRGTPLIENFCRKGEVVLLTAASKMGKSWFFQNCAICIAEGVPFLGLETARSDVLMLDLELSQADAMDRLWSISLEMGLKQPPKGLHLWSLRKYCYDIDVICKTLHNRLVELPKLSAIFVDPIYMLGQSDKFDENSSAQCTILLTELEKIAAKNDCALLLSHHFRKGNMGRESHIDRGSGSGVFARFPDCLVSLSPHSLAGHAIFEMTSRSQKSPHPFVIKMTPPVLQLAENADPYAHRRYGDRPENEITDETIIELIKPGVALTKTELYSKARLDGVDQTNFDTHFNSLRSSGRVTAVDRDGVPAYKLTIQ
jgi:hypothetical protein